MTEEKETVKKAKPAALVPVMLLKSYRPMGEFKVWTVEERDDDGVATKYGKRDPDGKPDTPDVFVNNQGREFDIVVPASGEYAIVPAGRIIDVPKKEANRLLKLRIGEKPLEQYDD